MIPHDSLRHSLWAETFQDQYRKCKWENKKKTIIMPPLYIALYLSSNDRNCMTECIVKACGVYHTLSELSLIQNIHNAFLYSEIWIKRKRRNLEIIYQSGVMFEEHLDGCRREMLLSFTTATGN